MTRRFTRILMLVCAAVCLTGCGGPLQRFEFTRVCMGVQTRIVTYAPEAVEAEAAAAKAFERVAALDGIMSDYRPQSEAMRLCASGGAGAGGAAVPVSADLVRVLREGRAISDLSGGAFDMTVGPATRLWREARKTGKLPEREALERAAALIDYRAVELDERGGTARIARPGVLLDLGGIAKCDAAQQALEVLRGRGLRRSMVALAGDIAMGDAPPGEDGWSVAVVGEQGGTSERPWVLTLRNTCVSTSGDTEQFVEIEGRRYSHIVDPRTGIGTPGGVSVTTIDADGARADALATAGCVLGPEAAVDLLTRGKCLGIVQFQRAGRVEVKLVGDAKRIGLGTVGN